MDLRVLTDPSRVRIRIDLLIDDAGEGPSSALRPAVRSCGSARPLTAAKTPQSSCVTSQPPKKSSSATAASSAPLT